MELKRFFLIELLLNILLIKGFMDVQLINSYIEHNRLRQNVIFACGTKTEQIKLIKELSKNGNAVISVFNIGSKNFTEILMLGKCRMGIILDADCLGVNINLLKCNKFHCFDVRHFWLLLHKYNNYENLLKNVKVDIDSDVNIACYNEISINQSLQYVIKDAYNFGLESKGRLADSIIGYYNLSSGYNVATSVNRYQLRRNLSDMVVKGIILIQESFNGTVEHYLENLENTNMNIFDRFHFRLLDIVKNYYSLKFKIEVTKSWGYQSANGSFDGLVGGVQGDKNHLCLSAMFVRYYRLPIVSFGKATWNFRSGFLLTKPKSRKSYEIFLKPLTLNVWRSIIIFTFVSITIQKFTYKAEKRYKINSSDSTWSFSTICTFGAFCQQGATTSPKLFSARIVTIFTLLFGSLVYQFYSASLVAFLINVPTKDITTMEEILDQDFRVGCEDTLYNRYHFTHSTDYVTRKIYSKLLKLHHNHTGFLDLNEGLRLVKKGGYAYHTTLESAYPVIEKEFNPAIICQLREISMLGDIALHTSYAKKSEFKEPFDSCLQRLGEYGVINREYLYWHPRKPECMKSGKYITINTALEDFYPALAVLCIGTIIGILILFVEISLYRGWNVKKCRLFIDLLGFPQNILAAGIIHLSDHFVDIVENRINHVDINISNGA